MNPEQLAHIVAECYREMQYRPTAVALIVNSQKKVLFVQSAKNTSEWTLPQGGIDRQEDAAAALLRELKEELGISAEEIATLRFLHTEALDAETEREDKRGFQRGKQYFFFLVEYTGNGKCIPEKGEVGAYAWVVTENVRDMLRLIRKEKAQLVEKALAAAAVIR